MNLKKINLFRTFDGKYGVRYKRWHHLRFRYVDIHHLRWNDELRSTVSIQTDRSLGLEHAVLAHKRLKSQWGIHIEKVYTDEEVNKMDFYSALKKSI